MHVVVDVASCCGRRMMMTMCNVCGMNVARISSLCHKNIYAVSYKMFVLYFTFLSMFLTIMLLH